MSRTSSLFVAICLCVVAAGGVTQASVLGSSPAPSATARATSVDARSAAKPKKTPKHETPKRKAPPKRVHGLVAPTLLTPANHAGVQQIPTLTWSSVGGAVEYEYEVAADPAFHSIVLGTGTGKGSATTYNLAATLEKPVTDGTYYWRVRGLTASKAPGPWSGTRELTKAWSQSPQLMAPANGAAITWPSVPLVLEWTPVSSGREYIVTIATDEHLANVVLGSATSPTKTWGSVFALPGTLPAGLYYWAITPLDAEGHRGAQSAVRTFTWSWPTKTSTHLTNLAGSGGFEPEFSWAPVPGAAHYEVEINQSPEFPTGSKWCCSNPIIGNSFAPTEKLANDHSFWWRVRAIDARGNAGEWNEGESFTEAFDPSVPTIPNLTMTGINGEPLTDPNTNTPMVTWSPVRGAATYEVQVTNHVEGEGCNWAQDSAELKQAVTTSALAWTPLAYGNHIGPTAWPSPDTQTPLREEDTSYCVRVLARAANDAKGGQVISDWTQIGGANNPAFTFESQPPPGKPGPAGLETPASAYLPPRTSTEGSNPAQVPACSSKLGIVCRNTPFFTWNRVSGASSYYVVTARDAGFTDVVDVAKTTVPAYAPRLEGEEPLDDQTNAYYWGVVPVNAKGEVFSEPPVGDSPESFTKSSLPTRPQELCLTFVACEPPISEPPFRSGDVSSQPIFDWAPAEGALDYTLQVGVNETFAKEDLLDEVKTTSTSYTTSTTYPADATLYWRVRANDANSRAEGLNWSSPVQKFTRSLPAPTQNPSATPTEAIQVLSWTPVQGATAYEVRVEQPDGTTKEFTQDSTAFTPTEWDGPGIWRQTVRAEFPTGLFGNAAGSYSQPQPLAHTFGPPPGVVGEKSGSRVVIRWQPEAYAREYEVQISKTSTFSSTLESHRTEQSSWAPNINLSLAANRGTLYWRVASVDNRSNVGPYATGVFVAPKPKPKCVVKKVKKGKKTVKECVVVKKTTKKKKK